MRLFSCLIAWLALVAVVSADSEDPYRASYLQTLRSHSIEPSAAGAVAYLRELHPDCDARTSISRLIQQLDHQNFSRREQAMTQLVRIPVLPIEQLARAAATGNAEVRWRALRLLDTWQEQSSQLMLAALRIIALDRPAGACSDVLAAIPFCREPYLAEAAHDALRSVVQTEDAQLLTASLQADHPPTRIAAAIALNELVTDEDLQVLAPLLEDPDERVALATARIFADRGDRNSLKVFAQLLQSDDAYLRAECGFVLRALTGRQMGFASYDDPAKRAAAVAAWQNWIEQEGQTAKLVYPVARSSSARGNLLGNTLVSTGSKKEVKELDPTGNVVWKFDIDAWSAEKLPNGNVLIASYTERKVVEVSLQGEVVWTLNGPAAMTAKPLLNGNILVADFNGRRVLEVDRRMKTVWQHATQDQCFDADRLPNGNTIFGCPHLVREVTPDGRTVRQWEIKGRLNGFQSLPNGNILVANYGTSKVYELNPIGKIVWEFNEPQPCDAFRLSNGHTLISTAKRIIEIDAHKRLLRELTEARYGSARR